MKIENRRCPLLNATCKGKLCALTGYQMVKMVGKPDSAEWICDMSDRVVERE